MTEEIQRKMQKELEQLSGIQKEYRRAVAQKQQLDSQLNGHLSASSNEIP